MKPIPLTRARHASNFAIALRRKGSPVERYLGRSHLPVDLVEQVSSDSVISALSMLDFAEKAAAGTGIRDLGYWAGMLPIEECGDFGARVGHAPSLYAAIQTFCSQVRGECSAADYYLINDGAKAWFCHGPFGSDFRQHELYALMIMMQVIWLALGSDWRPAMLRLQQDNEAALYSNDFLLGSNIQLNAVATGIEIPLDKLATAIPDSDRKVSVSGMRSNSDSAPFPIDPLSALQELISDHIRKSRKPSIEFAAEVAGVSTRTLQRYLSSKATSYSSLIDQVRFNMAMPLLNDGSVSITEK